MSNVKTCWDCWSPWNNASNASIHNESGRVCPDDKPYVAGSTGNCGCMRPWHGKLCSEQKCCMVEEQCYGNCGDYTALYIFLGVLGGVLVLAFIWLRYQRKKKAGTKGAQETELVG
eukprot:TRINITY_DN2991_c0_g2_i2.p6 TRINITY_DN2991_c0_g2~~TRINITY_DN2991_c0_g2_i2.p6  ORF type:complete len:116 (+),score=2.22 TRINITY_DN2991_c0_g2_i2:47-394(+)